MIWKVIILLSKPYGFVLYDASTFFSSFCIPAWSFLPIHNFVIDEFCF